MSKEIQKFKKRKKVQKKISELYENSDRVFTIWYSCESFYNGRIPRITSIVIRNLESGESKSFSIHKTAKMNGIKEKQINKKYELLEKKMLKSYFKYIARKEDYSFVHWNMRDSNYGFIALEERYEALGKKPYIIPDDKKFFLGKEIALLYGKEYMDHGEDNLGRFLNLIKFNKITDNDALTGKEEAIALKNKEYMSIHQSTLRKADCLAVVFNNIAEGTLKTKAKWKDTITFHPKIIIEVVKEHWIWTLFTIIATILGFVYLFKDSTV